MEKMRLKNKVAIVTGGAQGIGKAYVLGFSREGAKVVIADINIEAANKTAEEVLKNGGEALAIKTDASSVEDTQEMVRKTIDRFGRIDILVNNAAIFGRVRMKIGPFDELEMSEWDRSWDVNVKGPFLCCRAVFPYMKNQRAGKIINISSSLFHKGGNPYFKQTHYVAQKGAIIGLTRALAREMGEHNINVNSISPGYTNSFDPADTFALASVESLKMAAQRRAIKRNELEYPEDLVGTAIFLASSDSDFVTGQNIVVDGGDVMAG